jgi:hypothetical protein
LWSPTLIAWLFVAISKVWPSGGDFAVSSEASIVPAPGRLSACSCILE